MDLTDQVKKQIDEMSYEALLRKWRFSAIGDPIFMGDSGIYYQKVMDAKKKEVNAVAVSKKVGWEM